MKTDENLKFTLQELFKTQRLAVLSTHHQGQPYGSLVAFAATEDLKFLMFATTRATRKYENLCADPRVAMVIDNRSNEETDFHDSIAVTATGKAEEIQGVTKENLLQMYLRKHPYLVEFTGSPTCALLKVNVNTYYIVRRFQHVVELHIQP